MDVGLHNEQMAQLLVEQLIEQGVTQFCLSPGSRSGAIALAIANNPKADAQVHFDERGTCFYALGKAKGSLKPVAILVTTGSAAGNLFPAVMEASNDHIPLILITADRPAELQQCSANQTTDQIKLFTSFVRWQIDLPLCDPHFSPRYLASAIGQAVYLSQGPRPGPVHINCMLREPFFCDTSFEKQIDISCCRCEKPLLYPCPNTIERLALSLCQKKGLIIAGAMPCNTDPRALFALAEKWGWPIYADILSQMRSFDHPHLINYLSLLIETQYDLQIEAVIHFGGAIVSKTVSKWLKRQQLAHYLHISDYPTLMDPEQIVTQRLHAGSMRCAQLLFAQQTQGIDPEWFTSCKESSIEIGKQLSSFFSKSSPLSEPQTLHQLATSLKDLTQESGSLKSPIALFFANSMPIRDAEAFFPCIGKQIEIFGNRGVSGIDGNIATVAGIAQGLKKPLIAIIGDLALLHDMNSLALLHKVNYPVCIIVLNNAGGGIFSFLPVREKKEAFEKFFAAAHSYSFAHAARQFSLSYAHVITAEKLHTSLEDFLSNKQSMLLEICTDRNENFHLHQCIKNELEAMPCR